MTKWQKHESIAAAERVFGEALEAQPFNGSEVQIALHGLGKAIDSLPHRLTRRVPEADLSSYKKQQTLKASEVAFQAEDTVWAQMFRAQYEGYDAAERVLNGESTPPPETPAKSAGLSMSGRKR